MLARSLYLIGGNVLDFSKGSDNNENNRVFSDFLKGFLGRSRILA